MQFKQIIDSNDTVAFWTTENYNATNVFDFYNVHTLLNNGATLGAAGSSNTNFSNRSINLNSGILTLSDTTFNETQVASRTFNISFTFQTPVASISGFKPLISKWNPEQEYLIGFENGDLVAKIQTTSGVVSLVFPHNQIIYNNRYNTVTLSIRTTGFIFTVNGVDITSTNTAPIVPSILSPFTIGDALISEDIFISDIAITRGDNPHFAEMSYLMTHSRDEIWRDFNPTHYYSLSTITDIQKPIINRGSAGGNAYFVYDPTQPVPYLYTPQPNHTDQTVRLPAGSWLTIDQNALPIDQNIGNSFVFRGSYDIPTANTNTTDGFRLLDLANTIGSNNARMLVSYNTHPTTFEQFFGWKTYDDVGTISTQVISEATYPNSALSHQNLGVKIVSMQSGVLDTNHYQHGFWMETKSENNLPLTWTGTLPINSNRFWYNTGADGSLFSDLSDFAMFGYVVPPILGKLLSFPRFKLAGFFMDEKNSGKLAWNAHGFMDTTPNLRDENTRTDGPYTDTNGHTFITNVTDVNFNRQNQWLGATFLPTITDYVGGALTQDDLTFNALNFTINMFIWNRNTTTRYRLMTNSPTDTIEIWMNSRDGTFSYGNVEVTIGADTIATFSKQFIDFGFNMLTLVRDGVSLQLWVNAELETQFTTTLISNIISTDTTMRIYGGPCYFNEWSIWLDVALSPQDIELMFGGFNDVLRGQCTLNSVPVPSTLLVTTIDNGAVIKTQATDSSGNFNLSLIKSAENQRVNILALTQNELSSNNVVVHGPYNMTTTYSKFTEEYLLQNIDDMILDMQPFAYYKLNETTGTIVNDFSGNLRNATYSGSITLNQSGMIDGDPAVLLDGSSGFIDLPDGYTTMSTGFTIELMVNYTSFNLNARLFDFSDGVNENNGIYLNNVLNTDELSFSSQNNNSKQWYC